MSCSIAFVNYLISVLAVRGLHWREDCSLISASGATLVAVRGLLTAAASLVTEHSSRASVVAAHGPVFVPVALRHVGSSQIKDRTRISCIGSWIHYY